MSKMNFSKRQKDILNCLSKEMTNKEISAELGLSLSTVGVHLWLLFKKMGVRKRGHALARAKEQGFFVDQNLLKNGEHVWAERNKLSQEMYEYIKTLKSLSPEERRMQACLVTKYDIIFGGAYDYLSF